MTALVFVDTNVLLYAIDTRDRARQQQAAEWMSTLWRTRSGRTGVQVLNEFFVNATRHLRPGLPADEAWQQVLALMSWVPQPVDVQTLTGGRELQARYRLSWWDSLIVAAARQQGCSLLLTEDLQPRAVYAGVTVCDPFADDARELPAQYGPLVESPAPRRRGRPRRPAQLVARPADPGSQPC